MVVFAYRFIGYVKCKVFGFNVEDFSVHNMDLPSAFLLIPLCGLAFKPIIFFTFGKPFDYDFRAVMYQASVASVLDSSDPITFCPFVVPLGTMKLRLAICRICHILSLSMF